MTALPSGHSPVASSWLCCSRCLSRLRSIPAHLLFVGLLIRDYLLVPKQPDAHHRPSASRGSPTSTTPLRSTPRVAQCEGGVHPQCRPGGTCRPRRQRPLRARPPSARRASGIAAFVHFGYRWFGWGFTVRLWAPGGFRVLVSQHGGLDGKPRGGPLGHRGFKVPRAAGP